MKDFFMKFGLEICAALVIFWMIFAITANNIVNSIYPNHIEDCENACTFHGGILVSSQDECRCSGE